MDTNFAQKWLGIVPRCLESIDLIQIVTPHLSGKISDLAHCVQGPPVAIYFWPKNGDLKRLKTNF